MDVGPHRDNNNRVSIKVNKNNNSIDPDIQLQQTNNNIKKQHSKDIWICIYLFNICDLK